MREIRSPIYEDFLVPPTKNSYLPYEKFVDGKNCLRVLRSANTQEIFFFFIGAGYAGQSWGFLRGEKNEVVPQLTAPPPAQNFFSKKIFFFKTSRKNVSAQKKKCMYDSCSINWYSQLIKQPRRLLCCLFSVTFSTLAGQIRNCCHQSSVSLSLNWYDMIHLCSWLSTLLAQRIPTNEPVS